MFVGVLPGPRNGMTLLTDHILSALRAVAPTQEFDIGRWYPAGHALSWRWRRPAVSLAAIGWIVWPRPARSVYLVGNSGTGGLVISMLQAAAARLRRSRLVVYHHHTYRSLLDPTMKLLVRVLGRDAVHVISCDELGSLLVERSGARHVHVLKPAVLSAAPQDAPARDRDRSTVTLGHLSNLTEDKGVLDVIGTAHRVATSSGVAVRCRIGGPFTSQRLRARAQEAASRGPAAVEFVGALVGDERWAFLRSLDVFLFPSRYDNESWAMVLDEALACGVPVITTAFPGADRVAQERVDQPGAVIALDADFVAEAASVLARWMGTASLDTRAAAAVELAQELFAAGRAELDELVTALADPLVGI